MKKTTLRILLAVILFICVERFCHKQTEGFALHKIRSDHALNPSWETPSLSKSNMDQLSAILDQPFRYLDSGGQCYVFASEDKQYVLKFFKQHHMRPTHWSDTFPLSKGIIRFAKKQKQIASDRLDKLYTSCQIANTKFVEKTGLIYLHLNKSENLKKVIDLYDPIGIHQKIDLDEYAFAIQKYAEPAYPSLRSMVLSNDYEKAKACMSSLLDLVIARGREGIADQDPRKRNFGFIDTQAIEVDLGSFYLNPYLLNTTCAKRAFFFETSKLRRWIKKYHPELSAFLEHEINTRLSHNF